MLSTFEPDIDPEALRATPAVLFSLQLQHCVSPFLGLSQVVARLWRITVPDGAVYSSCDKPCLHRRGGNVWFAWRLRGPRLGLQQLLHLVLSRGASFGTPVLASTGTVHGSLHLWVSAAGDNCGGRKECW